MRRFLLILLLAAVAPALHAQVYLGGYVGGGIGTTTSAHFTVMPEIGYSVSNNVSVGASVGFRYRKNSSSSIVLAPYVRGILPLTDRFSLFMDGMFQYDNYLDDHYSAWTAGLYPGIRLWITPGFGLTTRLAFLGFSSVAGSTPTFDARLSFSNPAAFGAFFLL